MAPERELAMIRTEISLLGQMWRSLDTTDVQRSLVLKKTIELMERGDEILREEMNKECT